MAKTREFVLTVALLAFTCLSAPGESCAAGFKQFVGFGDSTLDSGYFRYHTLGNSLEDQVLAALIAQGATGAFVANGVMNSTILASKFGLSAAPIGGGGTNYAVGGSLTAADKPPTVSVVQQIQNYLASVNGAANPHALYIVKSGDNDLNFVPNPPNPNFLSQQASALATSVAALQSAGARLIMVPNSYNSAVYAGLGGDIAPGQADKYAASVSYMSARWSALTTAGVHFIPADIDSLFRYVVHNPTNFGFTASSVLASSAPLYPNPPHSALFAILTPTQQREFLFIDGLHLTTAGQTIEADYEYSLLTAPSQISLLAESVVQNGLARAATIQGQIELSEQHRGPNGINAWVSSGASTIKFKNAPGFANASGIPFGGTVGIDYLTSCGVIVGAAFTAGSQTQGFSTGGNFEQVDETPSIYAAYKAGPVWGNVVASYGLFQDKISRPVPLGIFADQNHADTTGQSLALALRGGGDFKLGQIMTGPVAGLVMQQVHVDGFTETGTSGVTALSFGSQTRDSVVSQLGWRVLADVGKWQPFAEAKWNHEWAGKDRTVTASLTSVSAPSYTMDAAPVASDWGTASLGTSYKLNSRMLLRATASAVFFNPQMINYGGELGLNVSF
ncbi:MAG: autotransporter domain-containing protein [Desulfobacteraceae bacterium]|nr:autotransporter domain-containing protein [Desulfobacteraceae bacterium]